MWFSQSGCLVSKQRKFQLRRKSWFGILLPKKMSPANYIISITIYILCSLNARLVVAVCENTADTYYCIDTTRTSCSTWRDRDFTNGCPDYSDELVNAGCPPVAGTSTTTAYCRNLPSNAVGDEIQCGQVQDGNSDCDDAEEEYCYDGGTYTCRNSSITIPCNQFRDGRNDCGDNSDEGYRFDCRESSGSFLFKCTRSDVPDFSTVHCTPLAGDGSFDCPDGSDEQLYVGDSCVFETDPGYSCDYFIENSECNSEGVCACIDGALEVRRGSQCFMRVADDPCSSEDDCSVSMTGLSCNMTTSLCYCQEAYYIDNSQDAGNDEVRNQYTYCRKRVIGETCVSDAECGEITQGYCNDTTNLCTCNSDYIVDSTDDGHCIARVINDTCDTTDQCLIAMDHAECSVFEVNNVTDTYCKCLVSAYDNDAGDQCIARTIGEACESNAECNLIINGTCTDSECACIPEENNIPWIQSYNLLACSYGLGDLPCTGDSDCSLHFGNNSECVNSTCVCSATYYEAGYRNCSRFVVGTANCLTDDCAHIPNAECDSNNYCQCMSGYIRIDGGLSCELGGGVTVVDCNFACQYPWALALIIIGLLAIVVIVVILAWKKPWQKPEEKKKMGFLTSMYTFFCPCLANKMDKDEEKKAPGSVAPYSNGGPAYDEYNNKPHWTLRPKSGNPVMYDHMHLQAPNDPEVDAFFSGGKKRKRHGLLQPLGTEDQTNEVFVFKGEGTSVRASSPTKSNVHLDGYHRCGYELPDRSHCDFSTDSYYRMRMHKKESSHFIKENWHQKGKRRKPRPLEPMGHIAEEVPQMWTSEEEDDATLVALNGELQSPPTTSYVHGFPSPQSSDSPRPLPENKKVTVAFASVEEPIEEPMDTEDTSNLISDDEQNQIDEPTRVVPITPQDLLNERGVFTPEPTGVMSPGDISVTNLINGSQQNLLDTSGISEVAHANTNVQQTGGLISETIAEKAAENDDDDSSSSSEDDDDEDDNDATAAANVSKSSKKSGKKGKSGKGKKEKGKGGKKEKGGKKNKKDKDGGKKGKKDKKGGKEKKEKSAKKGKSSAKKNKNNNNNREDVDFASDVSSDFDTREHSLSVYKVENETIPKRVTVRPAASIRQLKVQQEDVFALSNEVDPMQFSRRSIHEDYPSPIARPKSRCEIRPSFDTLSIGKPTEKKSKKQVSFNTVKQELQDFSN